MATQKLSPWINVGLLALTLEDREGSVGPAGPSLMRVYEGVLTDICDPGEPAKAAVLTHRLETDPEDVYLCPEPKMISTVARS